MINVYDFDKTIYDGDSSLDFYFYCLKNKKSIIFLLPIQFVSFIKYKLKIIKKEQFKESFFSFLRKLENVDQLVEKFWERNNNKINEWYLKQKQETDVIISASPEFLLNPICKSLKVKLIATKVNKETGLFESLNCYGEEKVKRYGNYTDKKINKFYSDSLSDLPMMKISKKPYIIKKNMPEEYLLNNG